VRAVVTIAFGVAVFGVGALGVACLTSTVDVPQSCATGPCTDGAVGATNDAPSASAADTSPPSDASVPPDDAAAGFGTPQIACAFTKSAPNNQTVWDVAVSATGRIGFVGGIQGLVDGGTPAVDLGDGTLLKPELGQLFSGYAAELDTSCNLVWARAIPYAVKAAFDSSGNLWAAGNDQASGSNPGWITKLSPTGIVLYQTSFPTIASIEALAVDAEGNLFIAGEYAGTPSFGGSPLPATSSGNTNAWIAKLDANGTHQWSKGFPSNVYGRIEEISIHPSGDVVVGGSFGGYPAGGSLSLGGATFASPTTYPYYSGFIARLSTIDGSHVWSRAWEGTDSYRACITPNGATYFSGAAWTATDFGSGAVTPPDGGRTWFVARLAPDAGSEWGRQFSLTGPPVPQAFGHAGPCGSSIGEDALSIVMPSDTTGGSYVQQTLADGGVGWTGLAADAMGWGEGTGAIGPTRDIVWGGSAAGNDSDIRVVRFTR
jgi:hypothetical protein